MTPRQLPSDAPAGSAASPPRPGPAARPRPRPRIIVPSRPLIDEPAGIVISGCAPGRPVTVTASALIDGSVYEATATFTADGTGVVDTARHASTAGSYTGTDPFGLWWSATPVAPAAHAAAPPGPVTSRLRAETARDPVTAEYQRHWLAPGATVTEVGEPGVRGIFARLGDCGTGSKPVPLVLDADRPAGGLGPQPGGDRPGRRGRVGRRRDRCG